MGKPIALAKLRANTTKCEQSELPKFARQLQRTFGATPQILRSREYEKRRHLIFRERNNRSVPTAQCLFNIGRGASTNCLAQRTLGRRASQKTPLPKIIIFGDDDVANIARVLPNLLVISRGQPHFANMDRTRVQIGKPKRERWR